MFGRRERERVSKTTDTSSLEFSRFPCRVVGGSTISAISAPKTLILEEQRGTRITRVTQ